MRLAYVSTYLPQQCGIATYTHSLICGIREVAPEIEIKVVTEKWALPVKEDKFEVIPCWDRNENYVSHIIDNTREADIVHIQHEYSIYKFDDRLPEVIKRINQKKLITIHCIRPSQFSERGAVEEEYAKTIAQLAGNVIVHLPSQKSILTRLGIQDEKIKTIPHGTKINDIDKKLSRQKLLLPIDGHIILMFGFVKPHKDIHTAIDALHLILKKINNVHLFIAGGIAQTHPEHKRYAQLINEKIKKLNLRNNIIFPNRFFPNEDVSYIFGAADLVLFPYYEEDRSASGAFHLAIGAKKPIIASRIPKFDELKNISDELLVLPHNSAGIAKIAIRIFSDTEFKQYVIERTTAYRNKTSWQAVAKQHLALYTN